VKASIETTFFSSNGATALGEIVVNCGCWGSSGWCWYTINRHSWFELKRFVFAAGRFEPRSEWEVAAHWRRGTTTGIIR